MTYRSYAFDDTTTDPRHVIGRALAEMRGFPEIRPMCWSEAGRIVEALKARGMLADRRAIRAALARKDGD